MNPYLNRQEAGLVLAESLKAYANRKDVIILALPRGGVPVGFQIAKELHAPLDVFVVRKLGVPGYEELAMGAIASGNVVVFNEDIVKNLGIPKQAIDKVIDAEQMELKRREVKYRGNRTFPDLKDKTIILVDDGIATGATMRAAIQALHQFKPSSIVIAVPVAEPFTCQSIGRLADKIICPLQPESFSAVGAWYREFPQTSDEEVETLLRLAALND